MLSREQTLNPLEAVVYTIKSEGPRVVVEPELLTSDLHSLGVFCDVGNVPPDARGFLAKSVSKWGVGHLRPFV